MGTSRSNEFIRSNFALIGFLEMILSYLFASFNNLAQPNDELRIYSLNDKIMKKQILLLITIGILCSCSNDDANESRTIAMRVNHYQNTGMAVGPVLTLLVQEGDAIGTNNWSKFYTNIEGFNYVPGKIYNLSVLVEPIKNPPADGSSLKYTLLEVKSIQEVDNETLFDIDLKSNGQSFITTNSGYELLNQIEIDCNSLCDELKAAVQNQGSVVGTFKRVSSTEIRLVEVE